MLRNGFGNAAFIALAIMFLAIAFVGLWGTAYVAIVVLELPLIYYVAIALVPIPALAALIATGLVRTAHALIPATTWNILGSNEITE